MGKKIAVVLLVIGGVVLSALTIEGQVSVNVSVAPPPIVFQAPPRVVVVPESRVSYAPDINYNVFLFEGRYYSFHEGAWFVAATHRAPWVVIPVERVPRAVVAVPVKYYKVPPGHAKRLDGAEGTGGGSGKGAHGCPPGLAKQGRC